MVLHATTPKPFHCVLAAEPRVFETVSFCSLQEPFVQTPTTLRTFHLSVLPPSFDLAIELTENQCRSVCVCVCFCFFSGGIRYTMIYRQSQRGAYWRLGVSIHWMGLNATPL